jgi:hypothetical protein
MTVSSRVLGLFEIGRSIDRAKRTLPHTPLNFTHTLDPPPAQDGLQFLTQKKRNSQYPYVCNGTPFLYLFTSFEMM